MERQWKLGEDLYPEDSILDGITFAELILQVHCNCRKVTPEAVKKEMNELLETKMEDMRFLLEKNIDRIMEEALKGRNNG